MKNKAKRVQETYNFRIGLWKQFVANYLFVLNTAPEGFSAYCEKFRERWIAGS